MTDTVSDIERQLSAGPGVGNRVVEELAADLAERAWEAGMVDLGWGVIDTPVGQLGLVVTPEGLLQLTFGAVEEALETLSERLPARMMRLPGASHVVSQQLKEYFAGERRTFDLTIDWRLVSGFRAEVLRELQSVPYGTTVSYGDLAGRVGNPPAVRAVGSAMATNPIPIVLPCHRVLRAGGGLGGYGGGLDAKRYLLRLEGVEPPPP